MIRRLTPGEVEFAIECHPEHIPVEGNASAIDPDTDAETASWIRDQLDLGNPWAWCVVVVKARWKGFEGRDVLGCCSYESEEAFKEGGYYEDMKAEALADLNRRVAEVADALSELL